MNFEGDFNLKLLMGNIYQLMYNENIKNNKIFEKNLFLQKFDFKVKRLLNSTDFEYSRK